MTTGRHLTDEEQYYYQTIKRHPKTFRFPLRHVGFRRNHTGYQEFLIPSSHTAVTSKWRIQLLSKSNKMMFRTTQNIALLLLVYPENDIIIYLNSQISFHDTNNVNIVNIHSCLKHFCKIKRKKILYFISFGDIWGTYGATKHRCKADAVADIDTSSIPRNSITKSGDTDPRLSHQHQHKRITDANSIKPYPQNPLATCWTELQYRNHHDTQWSSEQKKETLYVSHEYKTISRTRLRGTPYSSRTKVLHGGKPNLTTEIARMVINVAQIEDLGENSRESGADLIPGLEHEWLKYYEWEHMFNTRETCARHD